MRVILFLFIAFIAQSISAQVIERQVVSSYGAYAETGGLSLSSTVGEVATSTLQNADIILTQGFQQPLPEDSNVSIINIFQEVNVLAYPNPTSQSVFLEFNSDKELELQIDLYDMGGKKLSPGSNNQFTVLGKSIKKVDLSSFSSGLYIIRLSSQKQKISQSIKVQKID